MNGSEASTYPLEISHRGRFQVSVRGRLFAEKKIKGREARFLLKRLAPQRQGQIVLDRVREALWSDLEASAQLYKALHHIRKAFAALQMPPSSISLKRSRRKPRVAGGIAGGSRSSRPELCGQWNAPFPTPISWPLGSIYSLRYDVHLTDSPKTGSSWPSSMTSTQPTRAAERSSRF